VRSLSTRRRHVVARASGSCAPGGRG
jgi:hypothetical protein